MQTRFFDFLAKVNRRFLLYIHVFGFSKRATRHGTKAADTFALPAFDLPHGLGGPKVNRPATPTL